MSKKSKKMLILLLITILVAVCAYFNIDLEYHIDQLINSTSQNTISFDMSNIPEYSGNPYVVINDNMPEFTKSDYSTESFEKYAKLDSLGRCGIAFASLSRETMPADEEERESISSIYPSGWKNKKYKNLVDGDYIYNRCHLIGWQLSAENANEKNLITGTRYMNVEGMLPFENQVAEYLNKKANKNNHVLYRITPIFEGNNLVASGVQMEAYSIEDNGKGVCFNVYVYNVQPGITINYETGDSVLTK